MVVISLRNGTDIAITNRDRLVVRVPVFEPNGNKTQLETDLGPATKKNIEDIRGCFKRLLVHAIDD